MIKYKYIVYIIDDKTNKIKETKFLCDEKEFITYISDFNFEKKKCKFITYKQLNTLEIVKETIKYL